MDSLERRLIRTYMRDVPVAQHQLSSYNHFVQYGIQKTFDDFPPIVIEAKEGRKYVVQFGHAYMEHPCIVEDDRQVRHITPKEARDRDLIYDGNVMVDIIERTYEPAGDLVEERRHTRHPIAKIPVMVGSEKCNLFGLTKEERMAAGECEYDDGGYFIIKGKERVLICQERINYNTIFVFETKTPKVPFTAEIRSMSDETGHSALTKAAITESGRRITFSLHYINGDIDAGIVFRAFGVDTVEELKKVVSPHPYAEPFLRRIERSGRCDEDGTPLPTRRECLEYIGARSLKPIPADVRDRYAEQVLENEIFPHLDLSDRQEKIILLGTMLDKLIRTFLGMRAKDDRDNLSLKRIETAGVLIHDLFRMLVKKMVDALKLYLVKRQDVSTHLNRMTMITNGIRHAFSTGNWGIQKNNYIRPGVSQILSRLSYMCFVSYLRRVVAPQGKEGKDTKIRQLHPTHFGMICPAETPEGHQVGIVKNMAVFARISVKTPMRVVRCAVEQLDAFHPFETIYDHPEWTRVFVNGVVVGCTDDPDGLVAQFRQRRVQGVFNLETSASFVREENEVVVFCDEGRMLRPFLTVDETGRRLRVEAYREREGLTWDELLSSGCVMYMDTNEIENSVIAMEPAEVAEGGFDVCELHPTAMFGNTAMSIPFPDHSQAPRNCYSSSMTKQALGTYSMAHSNRFDTVAHQMHYPQRPLVTTEFVEGTGQQMMPYGMNAIVAVATYGGYNQEDSIMINRAVLERGGLVTTSYRTHSTEERKKNSKSWDVIEVPPLAARDSVFNYSKLDDDGIVPEGTHVFKNDVIVGRTSVKVGRDDKEEVTDCSLVLKAGEEGVVDKVLVTYNVDGYKVVKVRVRTLRIPEIGDKFCLTPGHQVLTRNRGWVGIADVTVEDEVAQFNRLNQRLEFVHPTDTMCFDYQGDLYCFENKHVSIRATMDHRMYVQRRQNFLESGELISAKELIGKEGYYFRYTTGSVDQQPFALSIPGRDFSVDETDCFLLILADWYNFGRVVDGKVTFTYPCRFNGVKPLQEETRFLRVESKYNPETRTLYFNNPKINRYLAKVSHDRLPAWHTRLDRRQAESLMFAFCKASVRRNVEECPLEFIHTHLKVCMTQHPALRDDIVTLAQLAGWGIDSYYELTRPPWEYVVRFDRMFSGITKKHPGTERLEPYEGQVYCISVPSEVFLVRRNGRCVLTGNCSRHGQKGTCGMILPPEDMPFSASGIIPDIIINPHAFPSRMTINYLLETLMGKVGCMTGDLQDSTAFTPESTDPVQRIMAQLAAVGFDPTGNEQLFNGMTGEPLQAKIFTGVCYYQRLKHLVSDKMHARATGNVTMLARQPLEGRSRDGGLRCGEMERDCLIAHGVSSFVKERMFTMSDPYSVIVCDQCGFIMSGVNACRMCSTSQMSEVAIPYACKLLLQELNAMCIKTTIETRPSGRK